MRNLNIGVVGTGRIGTLTIKHLKGFCPKNIFVYSRTEKDEIKNYLKANANVLIVAHGNSLRALIQYLTDISNDEIIKLEIPNGKPIVYELSDNLKRHRKDSRMEYFHSGSP